MYHQFKKLADLDITTTPMEVGPTTHYVMGGVRVDADTQMSKVPGLFAAGECAAGINGANRLGGNSLSRPDRVRQARRGIRRQIRQGGAAGPGRAGRRSRWRRPSAGRWPRSTAPVDASGPFQIQYELQDMMQDNWSASSGARRRCARRWRR